MNYYEPRQRADGRWDYTCTNDGAIWPVGYCKGYEEWWVGFKDRFGWEPKQEEIDDYKATKDTHHTDGHATREEACECYKEYLLDHKLRIWKQTNQSKCQVCGEWTQWVAELDCVMFFLCEKHNNRDDVAKLYTAPDMICSSW